MEPRDDVGPRIERIEAAAYTIPTDSPESDGTLEWDRTTVVVVEAEAGGRSGLGYTYADDATALLVRDHLARVVVGRGALDVPGTWEAMRRSIRNLGRPGIASMAISAVDTALWDLKAQLLGLPLARLFGQVHEALPVYGSGGFTSYPVERLCDQLAGWAEQGIGLVKMKIGRDPEADVERVRAARRAVGPRTSLFVDANGGYTRKQALAQAQRFAEQDVRWLEEPVSSDDLEGLRLLRDRAPAGMEIAAGEYGYDLVYFLRMLEAGAVDTLQADATRCGGFTEFARVSALCAARSVRLSSHTAPALHLHVCCSLAPVVHLEWFHDHTRLERMLFDGAAQPVGGLLRPDASRPGLGLTFKRADARRYAA